MIPTEGGHTDLAPRDEIEIALLRFLLRRHAHVSYERVLSGQGIETLYEFVEPEGVTGTRKLGKGSFALQGHDPKSVVRYKNIRMSTQELEVLVRFYPQYAFWLASGRIAPEIGQTSPEYDAAQAT